MKGHAPAVPKAVLIAIRDAGGEPNPGWTGRFIRAVATHGLAVVPHTVAMYDALLRQPAEVLLAPEPEEGPGMTLTYHHPAMIVWAVDVPRQLPSKRTKD